MPQTYPFIKNIYEIQANLLIPYKIYVILFILVYFALSMHYSSALNIAAYLWCSIQQEPMMYCLLPFLISWTGFWGCILDANEIAGIGIGSRRRVRF